MIETGPREESTVSFALPVIDVQELKARWQNKETLLQQMLNLKRVAAIVARAFKILKIGVFLGNL